MLSSKEWNNKTSDIKLICLYSTNKMMHIPIYLRLYALDHLLDTVGPISCNSSNGWMNKVSEMLREKRTRKDGEAKDAKRGETVKEVSIVMSRTKKFSTRCCNTFTSARIGLLLQCLKHLDNPSLCSRLISLSVLMLHKMWR